MADTELSPPAFQFTKAASLRIKLILFTFSQKDGTTNFFFLLVSGLVSAKDIQGLLRITPRGTILTLYCVSLMTMVSVIGGGKLSTANESIRAGGGIVSWALVLAQNISRSTKMYQCVFIWTPISMARVVGSVWCNPKKVWLIVSKGSSISIYTWIFSINDCCIFAQWI